MAITIVENDKAMTEPKDSQKPCEILIGGDTLEGSFERCSKTGDLRIRMTDGFGDIRSKLPANQLATIKLKDGSGGEYHGSFNDKGGFTPRR